MNVLMISEIIDTFGINPEKTGNNPRQWWIVEKLQEGEIRQKVKIGDLCVQTKDGEGNQVYQDALRYINFVATIRDSGDPEYRYYYFRKLADTKKE